MGLCNLKKPKLSISLDLMQKELTSNEDRFCTIFKRNPLQQLSEIKIENIFKDSVLVKTSQIIQFLMNPTLTENDSTIVDLLTCDMDLPDYEKILLFDDKDDDGVIFDQNEKKPEPNTKNKENPKDFNKNSEKIEGKSLENLIENDSINIVKKSKIHFK